MKWIGPLFTNASGWSAFVSSHQGDWYIDRDNPIKIGKGKSPLMLLPIMEKGYGENYSHQISLLKAGLAANDQDINAAQTFPFHIPVLFAFQNRLIRWSTIAAEWIEHIELNNDRAQLLLQACQDKEFSEGIGEGIGE